MSKLMIRLSEEILKDLNKSGKKKMKLIINKKYPGAKVKRNNDGLSYYEDMINLYDPPNDYTIEERIMEMEEHLNSLLDDDLV